MMRLPDPPVRLSGERPQIFLPAQPTGEWRLMGPSRQSVTARRVGVAVVIAVAVLMLMGAVIHAA